MCRSAELRHWFIQLRLMASSIPRCRAYILRMKAISIALFFPRILTSSLLWGRVWILQPVEGLTFFGVPLSHTQTDPGACPWGCSRGGLLLPLGSQSSLLSSVLCLALGQVICSLCFQSRAYQEEIPHTCQHEQSSSQWKLQKKNICLKLSLPFSVFVIPRASVLSGHWTLFSACLIHHSFNPCLWNSS